MVGRPLVRSAAVAVLVLSAALGCHQRVYTPAPVDAAGGGDSGSDAPTAPSLAISVTGCNFDVYSMVCSGTAPLSVSFSPVGSPAFTQFLWSFGDATPPSTERAPMHTFTFPGSYDVGLTGQLGQTGGTVPSLDCLVSVAPLTAGAACDVDKQCSAGLQCLCQVGAGCGPAFSRGICSTTCASGFCGNGAVCADIALGPTGTDGGAAAPVCLADCSGNATCGPGYVCQQIPGGPNAGAWIHGCLPLGAANDFGLSCRDANGVLQDGACTTGLCADVGVLGMCTAACDGAHPCPAGAACARLSGGRQLCLPGCSTTIPCTGDPGLACTTAGDAGVDGGLTISEGGTAGAAYCAPL